MCFHLHEIQELVKLMHGDTSQKMITSGKRYKRNSIKRGIDRKKGMREPSRMMMKMFYIFTRLVITRGVYVCVYVCIHMHIYIHMCVYIYTHTRVCVYTYISSCFLKANSPKAFATL